jgi:hypothetical protein
MALADEFGTAETLTRSLEAGELNDRFGSDILEGLRQEFAPGAAVVAVASESTAPPPSPTVRLRASRSHWDLHYTVDGKDHRVKVLPGVCTDVPAEALQTERANELVRDGHIIVEGG